MVTTQDILNVTNSWSESERVQLVEALLATFGRSDGAVEDIAQDWQNLAVRRAAELDSGKAQTISWDEVRREGEQRIHDRKTCSCS